jgi:hypothetical protein
MQGSGPTLARRQYRSESDSWTGDRDTSIETQQLTTMAMRTLKLALLAIVAIVVCSVYAQATEKSATKVDVSSFSTQEIEEQLQVFAPCR